MSVGVLAGSILGAHAVAQASPPSPNPNETGQVVYVVNNSARGLVFDEAERVDNIADRSASVASGETGFVKSASATDGPSFTYMVGDIPAPALSVHILTTLDENGVWQTTCQPGDRLTCTVSPAPQKDWPVAVTVESAP